MKGMFQWRKGELQRAVPVYAGGAGRQLYRSGSAAGLAQSGVSRSVRELEERLGVQLLVRTTRKLSPTQAGEQLYQKTASGFEMLDLGLPHWRTIERRPPARCVSMPASTRLINACCQSWRYLNSDILISGLN